MAERIRINIDTLNKYADLTNKDLNEVSDKIPSINEILEGSKNPTFNQLSIIARYLNIPTGLLLLNEEIESNNIDLNFRTVNSQIIESMSDELKDTIEDMLIKQEFLRDEIDRLLEFVGKFDINDNDDEIIKFIRDLFPNPPNKNKFNYYRREMNRLGVFIFLNGKVGDNTNRPLNTKEFRGFVLSDKYAPIIFINQKDSKSAQLFTIIHEFIHLLLGQDDILSETPDYKGKSSNLESKINRITAEILVPKTVLRKSLRYTNENIDLDFLANKFEVSKQVIIIRLKTIGLINQTEFNELNKELKSEHKTLQDEFNNKSNGGNYKNNLLFRMDSTFFRYVRDALNSNKITYTDAFEILGTGYKGYKILEGEF